VLAALLLLGGGMNCHASTPNGRILASTGLSGLVKLSKATPRSRGPAPEADLPGPELWPGTFDDDLDDYLDGLDCFLQRTLLVLPVMLLALFPVLWVSAFVHELGHALLGRLSGYRVTSFGLGVARPILVCNCRGTRLYLCLRRPLQGITFFLVPQVFPPRRAAAAALAGGIVGNVLLALVGLALWHLLPWGGTVWLLTPPG
jgi:hypothetical protein